jgi:hypothetical protein
MKLTFWWAGSESGNPFNCTAREQSTFGRWTVFQRGGDEPVCSGWLLIG